MVEAQSTIDLEYVLQKALSVFVIGGNGQLLHYESFNDEVQIDPDLYSTFFTAINHFALEIDQGEIERIDLYSTKLVFKGYEDVLVVVEVDDALSDDHSLWLISQVIERYAILVEKTGKTKDKKLDTLFMELGSQLTFDIVREIRMAATVPEEEETIAKVIILSPKTTLQTSTRRKLTSSLTRIIEDNFGLEAIILSFNHIEIENIIAFSLIDGDYLASKISPGLIGILEDVSNAKDIDNRLLHVDEYYYLASPIGMPNSVLITMGREKEHLSDIDPFIKRVTRFVSTLILGDEGRSFVPRVD
ncbi:MAG: hypothetical protein ACTSYA_01095 [Candidatus Kariarchaeaceae archaeon]